ncbi:MAG: hypothetical protein IPL16_15515 [Ignavibacteria bacterium]|nr:hypothetical protein [Ignavibacteria bacterium]
MKKNKEKIQTGANNIPGNAFNKIINFSESRPFDILGPHLQADSTRVVINAFLPQALNARIKNQRETERNMKCRN